VGEILPVNPVPTELPLSVTPQLVAPVFPVQAIRAVDPEVIVQLAAPLQLIWALLMTGAPDTNGWGKT